MKEVKITSNSGILSGTLFEGYMNKTILVLVSASGVKQKFYKKFATYIAHKGITVITFDYYGIGRSLEKPIKKLKNNAADWGQNDLESVIQFIIKNYPNSKKVALGHSIGGQLIGLAQSSEKLDKIILIGAQSGYWKHWKGISRLKMWGNWYVFFPILINLYGYLNSRKISRMENLPKNVANQWRNWSKNYNYILSDKSIHQKYYDKIKVNLTEFSIEDDKLAPLQSVKWMTMQYKNAVKKSIHLRPADYRINKIGHFGVFKEKFNNTIWQIILKEIEY